MSAPVLALPASHNINVHSANFVGCALPDELEGDVTLVDANLVGFRFPRRVGGTMRLVNCDLLWAKLPDEVYKVSINDCRNTPSAWLKVKGEPRRRVIHTYDGRTLWQTENDRFGVQHYGFFKPESLQSAKQFIDGLQPEQRGKLSAIISRALEEKDI